MEVDPVSVFNKYSSVVSSRFKQSLPKFAGLAWQHDLITQSTKGYAIRRHRVTEAERADLLLSAVSVNMGTEKSEREKSMELFLDIVQDTLAIGVYNHLDEKWKETKDEKAVLKASNAILIDALQHNLIRFAAKLKTVSLLTDTEHSTICDPQADDTDIKMHKVLSEICETIKASPEKMELFVEKVVGDYGGYAEDIVEKLREGIPSRKPNIN